MPSKLEHIQAAVEQSIKDANESSSREFKAEFDPTSANQWIELIKDMVSIANTGGGIIVVGVSDDGAFSGHDCTALKTIDPAQVTDRINKYTGRQFDNFALCECNVGDTEIFAFAIGPVNTPLVFIKPGTYDIGGGKQKTVFSAGTVYFRHGPKSEPGNSDDLEQFVERRVNQIRKTWTDDIARVVEAPTGSQIQIIPPGEDAPTRAVRLTNDPNAPAVYKVPIDDTHPYRQKEVVAEINRVLKERKINSYHIQCVRQVHKTDDNPAHCYKQKYASTRYSRDFVEWIIGQYQSDPNFFDRARAKADELRRNMER